MDVTSIITIVIGLIVVYLFIKFILSPIIRVVLGIIIFIIALYLLQRFGFDLDQVLAPFGISLSSSKWGLSINKVLGFVGYYIDQIKNFLNL